MMAEISICMPTEYIALLDSLVTEGIFPSRAEAVRMAIRDLLLYHKHFGIRHRKLYLKIVEEEVIDIEVETP